MSRVGNRFLLLFFTSRRPDFNSTPLLSSSSRIHSFRHHISALSGSATEHRARIADVAAESGDNFNPIAGLFGAERLPFVQCMERTRLNLDEAGKCAGSCGGNLGATTQLRSIFYSFAHSFSPRKTNQSFGVEELASTPSVF